MSRFQPLVSVVMPVYDVAPWVQTAINSIVRQTYEKFELIIVDDSSRDQTPEIIRSVRDSRIRIIETDHSGYVKALAAGIEDARGEWVARMDGDDIAHPERLQRTLDFIEEHPDCVIAGTAYGYITPNGTLLQPPKVDFEWRALSRSLLSMGRICYEPSMMFDRKTAIEVGLYDLDYPWKEITLWYRLVGQGSGYEMNSCYMFYRYYRSGSNTSILANRIETAKLRQRYDPEAYQSYYSNYSQWFPNQRSIQVYKFLMVIKQCRAAKDYISMLRYAIMAFRLSQSYQSRRKILDALTGANSLRFWKWPRTFGHSGLEVFRPESSYVASVFREMGLKFGQIRSDSFSSGKEGLKGKYAAEALGYKRRRS